MERYVLLGRKTVVVVGQKTGHILECQLIGGAVISGASDVLVAHWIHTPHLATFKKMLIEDVRSTNLSGRTHQL